MSVCVFNFCVKNFFYCVIFTKNKYIKPILKIGFMKKKIDKSKKSTIEIARN